MKKKVLIPTKLDPVAKNLLEASVAPLNERLNAQMTAEEQRAGLGRLSARVDPERAVAIVEEEDAVVVAHASGLPVTRA